MGLYEGRKVLLIDSKTHGNASLDCMFMTASGGAGEVEAEAEPDANIRKEPGIPTTCEADADAN